MLYAKIRPDGALECSIVSSGENPAEVAPGMKPLRQVDDIPSVVGFQRAEPRYVETDSEIIMTYVVVENHPEALEKEIARLKKELTNTDYKVIKCYEASLMGVESPYNIAELHQKRQAQRDKINELETILITK